MSFTSEIIERRGVTYVRTTYPGGETWMRADGAAKHYPDGDALDVDPMHASRPSRASNNVRRLKGEGWHARERALPPEWLWRAWRGLLGPWQPLSGHFRHFAKPGSDDLGRARGRVTA